jgi:hypothetical protein
MATAAGTIRLRQEEPHRARSIALALAIAGTLAGSFAAGRLTVQEQAPTRVVTVDAPATAPVQPATGHHHGIVKVGQPTRLHGPVGRFGIARDPS